MDHMLSLVKSIHQAKTISGSLSPILSKVDAILNCSACAFFVFQDNVFSDEDRRSLVIQNTICEGKYLDVIMLNDTNTQPPVFNLFSEASHPVYTKKFMSYPIFDVNNQLMVTI